MDVSIPCICPGDEIRHPDGDTVTLKDRLAFDEAMACKQAIALIQGDDQSDVTARRLAALVKQYLFSGIERWTLMNGKAIPVSAGTINQYLLTNFAVAEIVSEEAEALYNAQVLVPLVTRAATSSRPTPTGGSTSARKVSTASSRKRSSRSSISTIPTDDTVTST